MSVAKKRASSPHHPSAAPKVPIAHPEKVLFPEDGLTKADLVQYYRDVAHALLPYTSGRPLTLQRWPNGIHGPSFFEKQVPKGAPAWVLTSRQPAYGKRVTIEYPLCNDASSLVYFANLGSITFHVWFSRVATPDCPDFLLFDLDPFEGCSLATLGKVALGVRDELAGVGLRSIVKTTGGKGLHVLVPLAPRIGYADAQPFQELVARRIAGLLPEQVTLERTIAKRPRGTVYFDWVQLGKGKTYVPPFVVRARPGAPVSMPIAWSEVEAFAGSKSRKPTTEAMAAWSMKTVPRLLAEHGDPWEGAFADGQRLDRAIHRARAWA